MVIEALPTDASGVNFIVTTMPEGQQFSSAGVAALVDGYPDPAAMMGEVDVPASTLTCGDRVRTLDQ